MIVVQDSNNIGDSEGPSDFDVRHRFSINAIYELPFTGNGFKEGWQLSVVTQAQTGSPVNVVTGINTFNGVNNTLRPDLVGDPAIIGSVTQWFQQRCVRSRIAAGTGACSSSSFRCRSRRAAHSISAILAGTGCWVPVSATPTSR